MYFSNPKWASRKGNNYNSYKIQFKNYFRNSKLFRAYVEKFSSDQSFFLKVVINFL